MRLRVVIAGLVCALVVALPASAKAPTKRYSGIGDANNFKVTLWRHPHTVSWVISVEAPCQVPGVAESREFGSGQLPAGQRELRISRRGRFQQHVRGWNPGSDEIDFDLTGRFESRGAAGTFVVTMRPPQITTTCTSGLVHWTARSAN